MYSSPDQGTWGNGAPGSMINSVGSGPAPFGGPPSGYNMSYAGLGGGTNVPAGGGVPAYGYGGTDFGGDDISSGGAHYATLPPRRANPGLYTTNDPSENNSPSREPSYGYSAQSMTYRSPAAPPLNMRIAPSKPKPQFVQKLVDTRVREGEVLSLGSWIQGGQPPYKIKWFLEGKIIHPNERISIINDDGHVALRINGAKIADAGFYTVRASNNVGWDACSALVSVETTGEVDDSSFVSKDVLRQLNFLRKDRHRRPAEDPGELGADEKHTKPVFRKRPADCEAKEGTVVRLNCMVGGRPPPQVNWLRDGIPVYDGPLHKLVVNEGGVHSIIFNHIRVSDAGQYTVVAQNKAGQNTCQVNLGVRAKELTSAPRVLNKLQSIQVQPGQDVVFRIAFEGVPQPAVSWQRENKNIQSDGRRILIDTQYDNSSLYVYNASKIDSGWYQCTISNISGTASSRAKLGVGAPDHQQHSNSNPLFMGRPNFVINRGNKKNVPMTQPDTVPAWVHRARREETPESDYYSPYNPEPPSFRRPLVPTPHPPVGEKEPVRFTTRVVPIGDPTLQLAWFKDNYPLPDYPRYRTNFDRGHASLDIDYFMFEDQGVYHCVVQNHKGFTESNRVDMSIGNASQQQNATTMNLNYTAPSKPIIRVGPSNSQVKEGDTAKFTAQVAGSPFPQVTWFLNGRQIQSGTRFNITQDGTNNCLAISKIGSGDTGRVELSAHNQHGVDRSGASLDVLPNAPQWSTGPTAKPGPGQSAPVITSQVANANVMEGQPVKFEIQFKGSPTPRAIWARDGVEIQPSSDFQVTTTDKMSVFQIPEAFIEDSGTFTVKLQNPFGSVSSQGSLKVVPHTATTDESPKITNQLKTINTEEGNEVIFEVQCVGYPAPKATWFKDGVNVENNPDFKLSSSGDRYFLQINEVFADDAGKYEVTLSNGKGEAKSTAQLNVDESVGVTKDGPVSKPPSIDKGFPPQAKASTGDNMKLECSVSGLPQPSTTWYHKGAALTKSTAKYILAGDNTDHPTLTINSLKVEDAGEYILKVENDLGVTTCKTILQVIAEEAPAQPKKEESKPAPKEQVKKEETKHVNPPIIMEPLKPQTVPDGGQVVFTFKVKPGEGCKDPLKFIWYHKDAMIKPTADFDQMYDQGSNTAVLKIAEAFPEDDGEYRCVVETSDGCPPVETKAVLTVESVSMSGGITTEDQETTEAEIEIEEDAEVVVENGGGDQGTSLEIELDDVAEDALEFTEGLPGGTLEKKVGDSIELSFSLTGGEETKEVTWTIKGELLKSDSERIKANFDAKAGKGTLTVDSAVVDDSGEYICKVKSGDQSAQSIAQIKVVE